ncbi:BON domain-containing protein [Acuticoccus sp. M5D2P5]|uniref:BON domain-containing protein n=1 Tax=Acuticoccus kalidii TaxID=2910977 RepID=UPI001F3F9D03|nr:BON domain-containing protein [Acuticoccus kalidii]MCF3934825.1 BON domain-containing protein [Acuticoccus kalidii]
MRSDKDIKTDILAELEWDPEVNMSDIVVSVVDGAVTLSGTVYTYPERKAAERAVKRVRGVVSIAEDIRVVLGTVQPYDDSALAKRIAHVLEWDPALPHDKIQAEVRDGAVTLSGEVDWHFQREVVEAHVARIGGVKSVSNLLKVVPHAVKSEVKREIVRALHRNADLEAANLDIDVKDGVVRLGGEVKALYEKELVKAAVWKAPGVVAVEDHIKVT